MRWPDVVATLVRDPKVMRAIESSAFGARVAFLSSTNALLDAVRGGACAIVYEAAFDGREHPDVLAAIFRGFRLEAAVVRVVA